LLLKIADRGKGFAVDTAGTGLGLLSMRERVHFVGGEIAVRSTPGQGTRIGVRIPRQATGVVAARRQASA
jgi:signal transduction histidine kinase